MSKESDVNNSDWGVQKWSSNEWERDIDWKNGRNIKHIEGRKNSTLSILGALSYLEEMSVIEKNSKDELDDTLFTKLKIKEFILSGAKLGFWICLLLVLHSMIVIFEEIFQVGFGHPFSYLESMFLNYITLFIGLMISLFFAKWFVGTIVGGFTKKAVLSYFSGWFISLFSIGFSYGVSLYQMGKLLRIKNEDFILFTNQHSLSYLGLDKTTMIKIYLLIEKLLPSLSIQIGIFTLLLSFFPLVAYFLKVKLVDSNAQKEFERY